MKKLAALRKHLLESPLGLEADQLVTFAENGKIFSYDGPDVGTGAKNFQLHYEANIILQEYEAGPMALSFFILEWLKVHQPGRAPDALRFEADILDSEKVDLGFQIDLSEDIAVTIEEEGTRFDLLPEPGFDDAEIDGIVENNVE